MKIVKLNNKYNARRHFGYDVAVSFPTELTFDGRTISEFNRRKFMELAYNLLGPDGSTIKSRSARIGKRAWCNFKENDMWARDFWTNRRKAEALTMLLLVWQPVGEYNF